MRNANVGYVKDFVSACLVCAVLFGAPLSENQIAGILGVIVAAGALWLGVNDRKSP